MQSSVATTVKTVRETSDLINYGADEIASGNAPICRRALRIRRHRSKKPHQVWKN